MLDKLKEVEARLVLEMHDGDDTYLKEAELLLAKYNAEVLRLEGVILQKKKLLLSQKPQG